MRRGWRGAFHALCVALLTLPGSTAAAPRPPACFVVAFSPAFAHDRTVFCVTTSAAGTRMHRSVDAGRTWQAARTITARAVNLPDLVVSPGYASDRTVWVVSSNDGMWMSRDGGATFGPEQTSPLYGAFHATPFVAPLPVPRPAFVEAGVAMIGSGVYDALTGDRTVVGTPTNTAHFLVPPGYGDGQQAVAVGHEGELGATSDPMFRNRMMAFLCEGDFTCVQPVFAFGEIHPHTTQRIAPGDDVVVTIPLRQRGGPPPPPSGLRAWRTRDYGRTWSRWTGLERLLHSLDERGTGAFPDLVVTKSADAPRRLFAQTDAPLSASRSVPATQVWRSDDDGRTWRRVGYSWGPEQAHRGRGTLPWNDAGESIGQVLPWISAQPGGLLYAIGARRVGERVTNQHLWCSRDLGRTWRTAC